MPMVGDGMGAAIKSAIEGKKGAPTDDGELTDMANAIGEAVVAYIVANALVTGSVTSGSGSGGTVTGTLS